MIPNTTSDTTIAMVSLGRIGVEDEISTSLGTKFDASIAK